MEENKNGGKREFKKINDGEAKPQAVNDGEAKSQTVNDGEAKSPELMKNEDSNRTVHDLIIGFILIVASYGLTFFMINIGSSWVFLVVMAIVIINGVLVVRGFRRKRVIISVFGLAFLAPVLFIMLALGACGLMFGSF